MGEVDYIAEKHLEYREFLDAKRIVHQPAGFPDARDIPLNPKLFDWQRDLVHWQLRMGRANNWSDCGLGKTFMELEWARIVHERTNKNGLILTPLAVAKQTKKEGEKFDVGVTVCKSRSDVKRGINIANYERLDKFDPDDFGWIVLDESSILKSYDGSTRQQIQEFVAKIPYRLGASATPAPNDFMELGTQSEFVGSLSRAEMLAMFFVHDGGDTAKWRLKRHSEAAFYEWLSTFSVYVRKPEDLGYPTDPRFVLPRLDTHHHVVESPVESGDLFAVEGKMLNERRAARRGSFNARIAAAANLACSNREEWIVWCGLNSESEALASSIKDSVEVTGSMTLEAKEEALEAFSSGQARVIVTKGSIAGFGLNWQHCRNMVTYPDDSFERYYQQIRRTWRFGQKRTVNNHIVTSEAEGAVVKNLERKQRDAEQMAERISEHMKDLMKADVVGVRQGGTERERKEVSGEGWRAILGDCVDAVEGIEPGTIDYAIFSPPFASLYTYSDALADMGNCKTHAEFFAHFEFLAAHLLRALRPGRVLSFHCMNLPASKERDGFIGIHDFRGDLIRIFQKAGFIFHSEVCIWKDPVTAMQRTKAIGLLYKQLRKDSTISRQGIPDYLVTMRKPGVNTEPVTKTHDSFPVGEWQQYASPVWMDINPSDTLQKESAREQEDERHICPLQLEVIRRAIRLWTNEGDLVLSPFMGIGSEWYIAVNMRRRFVGMELKESYFQQAVANLKIADREQVGLFSDEP